MTGVRATWSSVAVEIDDTDPFGDDTPIEDAVHVPTVGLPIDINADRASLDARLADSLRYEARLSAAGAECSIKWQPDSTCFACPLYQGDAATPQGALCRLGREQDTLLTLIAVRQADAS